MLQVVQDSCQCTYGQSNIQSGQFLCFDEMEDNNIVTYRAVLLGTAEVNTRALVSSLEEWVATESDVTVGGLTLTVEGSCEISDLQTEEQCADSEDSESDERNTAVMVVAAGVIVLPVMITVAISA